MAINTSVSEAIEEEDVDYVEMAEASMKFWPCAPDGFLPNSVIRSIIQPKAPPDYSLLVKELDEKDAVERIQKGKKCP